MANRVHGQKQHNERWAEEAAEKRTWLLGLLKEGVAAIQSSEAFKRMLAWQARFHRYSFGNVVLIWMQRPTATWVAGFKTWIDLGRVPMKGRSIAIRAPLPYHPRDEAGQQIEDETRLTFKTVPVWDIADTTGPDLPAPPRWEPTEGDEGTELYEALRAYMRRLGWSWVDYQRERDVGPHGSTDPAGKEIRIALASPLTMLEAAAHEVGHALDPHLDESSEDVAETVAQGVAYVTLARFGYDNSDSSFRYIAGWTRRTDGAGLIGLVGGRIQRISEEVIEGIEAELERAGTLPALAPALAPLPEARDFDS